MNFLCRHSMWLVCALHIVALQLTSRNSVEKTYPRLRYKQHSAKGETLFSDYTTTASLLPAALKQTPPSWLVVSCQPRRCSLKRTRHIRQLLGVILHGLQLDHALCT